MDREIVKNDVSMDRTLTSAAGASISGRNKRVPERLGLEYSVSPACCEESLVIDDRCDLSPAQMVETKLTRVLGGGMVPVSHLQTRCSLHRR
jgi:hypothetical protein